MESVVFSKGSWHYWLATKYGNWHQWREQELCSYVHSVLTAMILVGVCSSLVALVSGLTGNMLAYWAVYIITGPIPDCVGMRLAGIFTIIYAVAIMVVGIIYLSIFLAKQNWKFTVPVPSTPSFVREAYRSWKTKTCRRVTFR